MQYSELCKRACRCQFVCTCDKVHSQHLSLIFPLYRRLPGSDKHRFSTAVHYKPGVQEDIYEEPDKQGATATTVQPGNFELTDCPAYVATASKLQPPHTATEAQTSDYEL